MTRTSAAPARAAELFHALSDETRLRILEMLKDGERCVCDLQADLEAAQSRLSFHLKVLRQAGLVTDRRDGRWAYYSVSPETMTELHDLAVSMQPSRLQLLPGSGSRCCG